MNKLKIFILLVLAVALLLPVQASDRIDSHIRFNDFYGEVKIRPDAEEDDSYEFVDIDTVIYEDDRIKTEEDSGAILGLEDMSTYVIKPETILIIHTEDDNVSKIEMLLGSMWGNFKKMVEGKSFEVEMSQCVAGGIGTIFRVFQSKDGLTNRIEVTKGLVRVTLNDGNSVEVSGGHRINMTSGADYTLTELTSAELSSLENEFKEYLRKMDEKLDAGQLSNKILKQTSDINNTKAAFETTYKTLKEQQETAYKAKELDALRNISRQLDRLELQASRYKGVLKEAEATISVAKQKSVSSAGNEENALKDCWSVVEDIEKLKTDNKNTIDKLKEELKKSSGVMNLGRTDALYIEAKSLSEDISDGLSYDFYKSAREKFEKFLNDLSKGEASEQNAFVKNYVQKMIKQLDSVPEADTVMKRMKYISRNISSCMKEIRKRLAQHKAVDGKSKSETGKSFVENASRTLSNCNRLTKVYEKADKMFTKLESDFEKSAYQTSEYKECQELWEKIKQAMPAFENGVSALSAAVASVKAQLSPTPAGE